MPCWKLFDDQNIDYKREILLKDIPIISVEASSTTGWSKYSHYQMGLKGKFNINLKNRIRIISSY
jgi:transketolase